MYVDLGDNIKKKKKRKEKKDHSHSNLTMDDFWLIIDVEGRVGFLNFSIILFCQGLKLCFLVFA